MEINLLEDRKQRRRGESLSDEGGMKESCQ